MPKIRERILTPDDPIFREDPSVFVPVARPPAESLNQPRTDSAARTEPEKDEDWKPPNAPA